MYIKTVGLMAAALLASKASAQEITTEDFVRAWVTGNVDRSREVIRQDDGRIRIGGETGVIYDVPYGEQLTQTNNSPSIRTFIDYLQIEAPAGGASGQVLHQALTASLDAFGRMDAEIRLDAGIEPQIDRFARKEIMERSPGLLRVSRVPHAAASGDSMIYQYQLFGEDGTTRLAHLEVKEGRVKFQYALPVGSAGEGTLRPYYATPVVEADDLGLHSTSNCADEAEGRLLKSCLRSALQLLHRSGSRFESLGSAVWLGGHYVLTAGHAVFGIKKTELRLFFGVDRRAYPHDDHTGWSALKERLIAVRRAHDIPGVDDLQLLELVHVPELVHLEQQEGPLFVPPLILSHHLRAGVRETVLVGAGYGWSHLSTHITRESASGNLRRRGTMRFACEGGAPGCSLKNPTRLATRHVPDPETGKASYACPLDSGSPLFAQLERAELGLVGILIQVPGADGCGSATALSSTFIDLTRQEVQQAVAKVIKELEGPELPLAQSPVVAMPDTRLVAGLAIQ